MDSSVETVEPWDVVIVGGGPAGLSAALALGRARRRVLLCDAGPRRNAAAAAVYNFVTRDGTPPDAFRDEARQQLRRYPAVEVRDARVRSIDGERGAFEVRVGDTVERAQRVVLCAGMVDEMLPLPGYEALWGRSIFQCPYCHGWELRDRRWAVLVDRAAGLDHVVPFASMLRTWTPSVQVFTTEGVELPAPMRAQLADTNIEVVTEAVARLEGDERGLTSIVLASGEAVPVDVLFSHPPQRQIGLVAELGLELNAQGFVQVDPQTQETSRPGIYAAGDSTTRMQKAIVGAAAGTLAGAMVNLDLAMDPQHRTQDSAGFWDALYRRRGPDTTGKPSAALARHAEGLEPGRALELGCGNGDDSVWLAAQGWRVTATDVSEVALAHAEQNAARREQSDNIGFERHDLTQSMPAGPFELVTAIFLHSPVPFTRVDVLTRAAQRVTPGGTLLIVGHASVPPWANIRADTPLWNAQQTLDALRLDADIWQARVVEDVPRQVEHRDGRTATVLDAVLVLRRGG